MNYYCPIMKNGGFILFVDNENGDLCKREEVDTAIAEKDAEIERLGNCCDALEKAAEIWGKRCTEKDQRIADLQAENAALRALYEYIHELEAENATLRTALNPDAAMVALADETDGRVVADLKRRIAELEQRLAERDEVVENFRQEFAETDSRHAEVADLRAQLRKLEADVAREHLGWTQTVSNYDSLTYECDQLRAELATTQEVIKLLGGQQCNSCRRSGRDDEPECRECGLNPSNRVGGDEGPDNWMPQDPNRLYKALCAAEELAAAQAEAATASTVMDERDLYLDLLIKIGNAVPDAYIDSDGSDNAEIQYHLLPDIIEGLRHEAAKNADAARVLEGLERLGYEWALTHNGTTWICEGVGHGICDGKGYLDAVNAALTAKGLENV